MTEPPGDIRHGGIRHGWLGRVVCERYRAPMQRTTAGDQQSASAPSWQPVTESETVTFTADLDRMNRTLHDLGAIVTGEDGWRGVDPTKAPAGLVTAYGARTSYGYARGLL
jgi:hypothetical protein